jgi:hypothetical protein
MALLQAAEARVCVRKSQTERRRKQERRKKLKKREGYSGFFISFVYYKELFYQTRYQNGFSSTGRVVKIVELKPKKMASLVK